MDNGATPSQVPILNDREYEKPLSPPPLGFVLKTAVLPNGSEEWNSRRQHVVSRLMELGVNITRHNDFVTQITGYFRDVLAEGQEKEWALQPILEQGRKTMGGPVEAMDMWLLEQPGANYFVPTDF